MLLADKDKAAVKQWLLPKLESIADAESDVLADYVVALLSSEGSIEMVKRNAVRELSEFLAERAGPFVDEVTNGIERRSWTYHRVTRRVPTMDTQHMKTEPAQSIKTESTIFSPAQISSFAGHSKQIDASVYTAPTTVQSRKRPTRAPEGTKDTIRSAEQRVRQSRKRKLDNRRAGDTPEGHGEHYNISASGLPTKQTARRGRPHARRGSRMSEGRVSHPESGGILTSALPVPHLQAAPTLPLSLPQTDFTNSAAFTAAMTGLMNMSFPSGSGIATATASRARSVHEGRVRCMTYDTQGFCFMGAACPYDHSVTPTVPDAYDPNRPLLTGMSARSKQGKKSRAPFSHYDPSDHHKNNTMVIEQIPEDHLSEEHVLHFFSQFGEIIKVQLQEDKRLAIIDFEDHATAQRAYDSPKVIFDNRFVKVYWHGALNGPATARYRTMRVKNGPADRKVAEIYMEDEDMIDREVFEQQQAEAQIVFEERRKRDEKAAAEAAKIQEKLIANEDQINELRRKLAEKARARGEDEISRLDQERAPMLMDNLSSLYAEAADLYAQHGSDAPLVRGRGGRRRARGRGVYVGRGSAAPRSAVKRWDNRPKRVGIEGVVAGSREDSALQLYLRSAGGYEDVQTHMERPNTLVVSFSERWLAEVFLDNVAHVPHVGKLQLSWIPNGESVVLASSEDEAPTIKREANRMSVGEDEGPTRQVIKIEDDSGDEADLDVADDADRWL